MSQILCNARKYEEDKSKDITESMRPGFHLSARVGWMNDPNGFSFYKGAYHLFYQYNPYSTQWGPMHWGHAVSTDLLHWEYLPAALAPDSNYDSYGCFSGSAVILPDNKHLLMYTGVAEEAQEDGSVREVQTQCLAIGNGVEYEKYSGNPVLDAKHLPENGSRIDFRDPKIWMMPDGTFRCVVGNCDGSRDGQVLLYSSRDAFEWKFEKILAKNEKRFGRMWECPDFFELDDKYILIVSPQDMLPQGAEYRGGDGTVCQIGFYDDEMDVFHDEFNQAIDYGIDFYAPQTMLSPDGRRIMIGWMQNWDTCGLHTREHKHWFGQMSIPRELSIRDGRLIQKPVRELEKIRTSVVQYKNVNVADTMNLGGISGRKIDMELSIRPQDGCETYREIVVRFAQNDAYYTSVSFRPWEQVIKVDRKSSGSRRAIIHQSECHVKNSDGRINLRIILDSYSAEIFVNDGEYVLTTTLYTDLAADGISFMANGQAVMDIVKYDLTP